MLACVESVTAGGGGTSPPPKAPGGGDGTEVELLNVLPP
jgi:hypothetical protein